MSIKNEIMASMKNFSLDPQTSEISAEFAFKNDFTGFQGHFPDKPILPGVCQIEMALTVLEKTLKKRVTLKTLIRGKFLNTVSPDETIEVSGTFAELADDTISAKFAIAKPAPTQDAATPTKNVKVSRLSFIVIVTA